MKKLELYLVAIPAMILAFLSSFNIAYLVDYSATYSNLAKDMHRAKYINDKKCEKSFILREEIGKEIKMERKLRSKR